METGLAAVERRLEELRAEAPTRQDLEAVVQALDGQTRSGNAANADLKQDLRQIMSELEVLRTLVEEQRQLLDEAADRFERTSTDVALIRRRLERQEAVLSALESRASNPPMPAVETVDPRALYNAAYRDYADGRYGRAVVGFRRYLDTFPDGADAGRAQYWLGESRLSQGRYQAAIEELGLVRERYPESDKVASSMLKMGVALVELGERELAAEMFRRVRDGFPDTDEEVLAQRQLEALDSPSVEE